MNASNDTPSSSPTVVLVVEDEEVSRAALAKLLRVFGYRPFAVASAEEALRLLDEGLSPQVVLVDVDLPGISGLDLVVQIEQRYPETRAILTTASEPGRIHDFCARHAADFLPKPLSVPRLLTILSAGPTH